VFADVVATVYQPDDYVWVHDYHLMRLPFELRQRFPDIPVGWSVFTITGLATGLVFVSAYPCRSL